MPLVLHEYAVSGNCYKIRLTAALLGVPLDRREHDILKGETRTPEFLAKINANGRIPVLDTGEGLLPESNACCWWLAHGSVLIPTDRFAQADMLRWMFWEQYNHEPSIATLRFWLDYIGEEGLSAEQRALIPVKRAGGLAALALMEDHLRDRPFFVGERISLADIVLYAYTHVAEGGGFDLGGYPALLAWLERIAAAPGYIGIFD
jgi:glutathione S-transferase